MPEVKASEPAPPLHRLVIEGSRPDSALSLSVPIKRGISFRECTGAELGI